MPLMTKEQEASIKRIMTHVHDMQDDAIIERIILKELNAAYDRGVNSIRNSPDYHYREDMGR